MAETESQSGLLQRAAERGQELRGERQQRRQEQREQLKQSLRERLTQVKERAKSAWNGTKEASQQVKAGMETARNVAEGFTDPALRQELRSEITEHVNETRDALGVRLSEIHDNMDARREDAVARFQGGVREIRSEVNEHVISPTLNSADRVKDAVVNGAREGALFTVGLGVVAAEAGKQAVESGIQTSENVKNAAEARAKEWSGRLKGFFRRQGEGVKNNMNARRLEISAAKDRTLAGVGEASVSGMESFVAKVNGMGARVSEFATQKRESSEDKTLSVQELRSKSISEE